MRVAVLSTLAEADLHLLDEACRNSAYHCTAVVTYAGVGELWARKHRLPVVRVSRPEDLRRGVDALIALWDGRSADVAAAIRVARSRGLLVYARVAPRRGPETT